MDRERLFQECNDQLSTFTTWLVIGCIVMSIASCSIVPILIGLVLTITMIITFVTITRR